MKSKGLHFRYLLIVLVIAVICIAILFKMSRTIFVEREKWQAKAEKPLYDTVPVLAARGRRSFVGDDDAPIYHVYGFCGRWFQSGYIQPLPRPALPGFGTDARRSYGRRI